MYAEDIQLSGLAHRIFAMLAFASFVFMLVIYFLGAVCGWPWVWPASANSAFLALLLVAQSLEAGLSAFTAGANGNATAVGLVLALAEEPKGRPLKRTRVWCVCTGCEEACTKGCGPSCGPASTP